jgi:DNA primase
MREQVLELVQRYLPNRRLKPSGGSNYLTTCPFPWHKGGNEKTPSFSINVDKGVFKCFTCHVAGGLEYFLHLLEVPRDRIDSETRLIKPFLERQKELQRVTREYAFSRNDPFKAEHILDEGILGVYDWPPEKLLRDGFDPALLRRLEIGYDRNNQRIMYPLRDLYGNLAGFSGGATLPTQHPKYLVYQGRRTNMEGRVIRSEYGEWFEEKYLGYRCENHNFIWNYDKVYPLLVEDPDPEAKLYIVEGFKACLWMIQCGYWNTVALMGSYISEHQQRMLHRLGCTVVLLLDNDHAGRNGTINIGDLLWAPLYGRVMVAQYPASDVEASIYKSDNSQPDDYEPEAIHEIVAASLRYADHFNRSMRRS